MKHFKIIWILLGIGLASCTGNKYLTEGQKYYEGEEVVFNEDAEKLDNVLKNKIYDLPKPEAPRKLFFSRPGV
jgi:hypothetical protein